MKNRTKLLSILAIRLVFMAIPAHAGECRQTDPVPNGGGRATKTVRIEKSEIRADLGGPKITLLANHRSTDIEAVSSVGILIDAPHDSLLENDSFRVKGKKGFFKRDYTDHARKCFWTGNLLQISSSLLPLGSYRVYVEIADRKARKSSIQINISVTPKREKLSKPIAVALSHPQTPASNLRIPTSKHPAEQIAQLN